MSKTITELKTAAALIKNETQAGKNTANRVGTMFEDIVDAVDDKQDKISDLTTVRSNANEGHIAYGAVSDGKLYNLHLNENNDTIKVNGHDYDLTDIANKVDKVTGKGLSTNDYTDADKAKVAAALTEHQDISGKVDKVEGKSLIDSNVASKLYYNNNKITTNDLNVQNLTAANGSFNEVIIDGVDVVEQLTKVGSDIGTMSELDTDATTLVGAINEVNEGLVDAYTKTESDALYPKKEDVATINQIKAEMENLPDGQAVSAQVATNTTDIADLAQKVIDNAVVRFATAPNINTATGNLEFANGTDIIYLKNIIVPNGIIAYYPDTTKTALRLIVLNINENCVEVIGYTDFVQGTHLVIGHITTKRDKSIVNSSMICDYTIDNINPLKSINNKITHLEGLVDATALYENLVSSQKTVIQGYCLGSITTDNRWVSDTRYIKVDVGDVLCVENTSKYSLGIACYNSSLEYIGNIYWLQSVQEIKITLANTQYIRVNFTNGSSLSPDTFTGATIRKVDNNSKNINSLIIKGNETVSGYWSASNVIQISSNDEWVAYREMISVSPNTEYVLDNPSSYIVGICYYKEDRTFDSSNWGSTLSVFKTPSTAYYMRINFRKIGGLLPTTFNKVIIKSQMVGNVPFLKYSNELNTLPNFNTSTNKLEFPSAALVHYRNSDYALGESYAASSYDIPTSGSGVKVLAFDLETNTFSITPANLLSDKQYSLGWFLYSGGVKSAQLPFPFTVNSVSVEPIAELESKVDDNTNPYLLEKLVAQGHLFMLNIGKNSIDPIIPSQTIYDVQCCARLGIKSIEANVLKTATDGKYIVMHGDSGCVGGQMLLKKAVYEANPDNYPYAEYNATHDAYFNWNTNAETIHSVENGYIPLISFEDLRNNYFNRSVYSKYQVPITSLEEFLYECKRYNIYPMLTYVDDTELAIIESIMGNYYGLRSGTRHGNSLHIYWDGTTSHNVSDILAIAKSVGKPFVYGFGTNVANVKTDEECKEIIETLHKNGFMVINDGNYYTEENNQRLIKLGIDGSLSGWHVPYFTEGNLYNYCSDVAFNDFTHNGVVSDGILNLSTSQVLTPNITDTVYFLAKEQVSIVFRGKIQLELGKMQLTQQSCYGTFESDGTKSMVFNSGVLNNKLQCRITALEDTEIISIEYKASKC